MENCRVHDDSLWSPNSSSFHGCGSFVNFEEVRGESNTERPLVDSKVENCNEEYSDGCFHRPAKKRRLTAEQVQFLEKYFEVENKLEPERKVELAKEIGLQPRQVAIWFQNRRARCKTKLLEKEYDSLKASYDKLKMDYDSLFTDNEKLKNEVDLLSQKLVHGNKTKAEPHDPISTKNPVSPKQEDAATSDVLDSDSPHHTNDHVNHLTLEHADSSHVFEADPSENSQDEDDSLVHFPKLEDDDLQPNSCNFGFPVQDQGTWFWQY